MITLDIYVSLLLAISGVAMYFIIGVLVKQLRLLKVPFRGYDDSTQRVLKHFRNVLFIISLTIIFMGAIPIVFNILALFIDTGRPRLVALPSLIYSLSVHIQGLLLSYLVSRLYRLADNEQDITDYTKHTLEEEAVANKAETELNLKKEK